MWVNCFSEYLIEKGLPPIDSIPDLDLPDILENFYAVVCKKRKKLNEDTIPSEDEDSQDLKIDENAGVRCAVPNLKLLVFSKLTLTFN